MLGVCNETQVGKFVILLVTINVMYFLVRRVGPANT